jgi:pimeloyl-ACP methyl ester carboxylesterase
VLDQLDLHDVVLVGHDASGPEAVDLALTEPDRVGAVVLLNTNYGHDPALHFPEFMALMADPNYKTLVDELLDDEPNACGSSTTRHARWGSTRTTPKVWAPRRSSPSSSPQRYPAWSMALRFRLQMVERTH